MATGFQRGSTGPAGREVAAAQLEEFMLGDTSPARDWSVAPATYQDRDRSVQELVEHYGGTKGLARATGLSQRQIERYAREGTERARRASQNALAGANARVNRDERRDHAQREWSPLVERYKTTKGLAQAAGVSRRTVQRWLAGEAMPNERSLANLQQADRRHRMRQNYTDLDLDHRGRPDGPVFLRAAGQVTARGPGKSPLYQYMRNIGVASLGDLGYEMPPDIAGDMFDAMHRGNTTEALDVLQRFLSEDYADFPPDSYSVEDNIGFFLDSIREFELN
jgi:hypothetical protein